MQPGGPLADNSIRAGPQGVQKNPNLAPGMENAAYVSLLLLAGLFGSIPTAVWVSRRLYGFDIRSKGSGNAGATNTFRVLGKKAGIFVLLFDISKGVLACLIPLLLIQHGSLPAEDRVFHQLLFGLTAVLGHIYPVFAGFRGGKGVASLLGMVCCVSPLAGLVCLLVFLSLFLTLHYVSVGSIAGALAFFVQVAGGVCGPADAKTLSVAGALLVLVVYTHRSNLAKLRAGTENKMYFKKQSS